MANEVKALWAAKDRIIALDAAIEVMVNESNRLTEENRKLREALSDLVDASSENEQQLNELLMCSDYGESQSLCKARQLLEELK